MQWTVFSLQQGFKIPEINCSLFFGGSIIWEWVQSFNVNTFIVCYFLIQMCAIYSLTVYDNWLFRIEQ